MRIHAYFVYLLTNKRHTALYTGMTNDLVRRVHEHRQKMFKGFTSKYNIDKLVYFESFDLAQQAIAREKQIKGYSRTKKEALINSCNPDWIDLFQNGGIRMLRDKIR